MHFLHTMAVPWSLPSVSWRISPICCCEFLSAIQGAELSVCQAVMGEQKREIITYIPPGDTGSPGDRRQYTKYRLGCRMSRHYLSLLSYDEAAQVACMHWKVHWSRHFSGATQVYGIGWLLNLTKISPPSSMNCVSFSFSLVLALKTKLKHREEESCWLFMKKNKLRCLKAPQKKAAGFRVPPPPSCYSSLSLTNLPILWPVSSFVSCCAAGIQGILHGTSWCTNCACLILWQTPHLL